MPVSQPTSTALAEALALHRQGRLKDAEVRYGRILAREPGNFAARYHLGLARLQRGNLQGGIEALRPLYESGPPHIDVLYNLGRAYSELGRHAEALPCFERAVLLQPNLAEVQFYLGMSLASVGRAEAALPRLQHAIALQPGLAEAHHALASVFNELGRYEAALPHFEKALSLRPDLAEAHNGLGTALCGLGRLEEAAAQYRRAIQLKPVYVEAHTGLSDVLRILGQGEVAAECAEQAVRIGPDDAVAHVVLGQALAELGQQGRSLAEFERALALQPESAAAHNELGAALHGWGRHAEARAHGDKALALDPDSSKYWSVQLFYLHYDPTISAHDMAARHRAFAERFEAPLQASWRPHANAPEPERRLRVGFVSPDFRRHSVGYFMTDLLAALKGRSLDLYAYAVHWTGDDLTERIKAGFDVWRECRMSDDALAEQIRLDGIDILVDLAGHTVGNRLLVFARKPAPVQVTYLGYPDTTGLDAMDYIIGDTRMFPESEEGLYAEKPWRLPDTSLCFMPPDLPVEVGPLPAGEAGPVTFGCLNRQDKINDSVIRLWAQILQSVPESCLLLQNRAYDEAAVVADMRRRFAAAGVESKRIELVGRLGWREHIEIYNRVDIALDPFPYNGTTTSVEGLWMGVPLVALRGDRLVAHMGESILYALGMPEWIAQDEAEYVAKAAAFAGDRAGLAAVRAQLRGRLLASPICDAPGFARNLEAAFRGMWRAWCNRQNA